MNCIHEHEKSPDNLAASFSAPGRRRGRGGAGRAEDYSGFGLGHGPAATAVLRQALNKTNDSETHKAGERALKGRAAKTPAGK